MKIRPLWEVLYLSLSYLHQIRHVGYPSGWIAIKGDDKLLLSDILDEQEFLLIQNVNQFLSEDQSKASAMSLYDVVEVTTAI